MTACKTYALIDAPTRISFYVVRNLLDLSLDAQEAEGTDSIEYVEQLRLREGIFSVILRLLERDAGLQKKRNS